MKLEELVASRELSAKLKELGYPQSNSALYWVCYNKSFDTEYWAINDGNEVMETMDGYDINSQNIYIAAPLAGEILQLLPGNIQIHGDCYYLKIEKQLGSIICSYTYQDDVEDEYVEALSYVGLVSEVFASTLIWLIQKGYVKFGEGLNDDSTG